MRGVPRSTEIKNLVTLLTNLFFDLRRKQTTIPRGNEKISERIKIPHVFNMPLPIVSSIVCIVMAFPFYANAGGNEECIPPADH
jgi:hypothetical protein